MCIVINMYWPEEDPPPPPCIQQIHDQDLGSLTFSEGGGVGGSPPSPGESLEGQMNVLPGAVINY